MITLNDDKHLVPIYNAALTMKDSTARKYLQIADLMAPIAAKLDDTIMRRLNAQVAVGGQIPRNRWRASFSTRTVHQLSWSDPAASQQKGG